MHIPDGFIPWTQCAIYYIILIVALYFATKWAKKNLDDKHVPLMAILAAGIFAIMSMNMPIPFQRTYGWWMFSGISILCS